MLASVTFAVAAAALAPGMMRVSRQMSQPTGSRLAAACMSAVEVDVTPVMESACSFDFIPLKAALEEGDFLTADQITRDALITLAGEGAVKRGYVYFSEVPRLPQEDIATIERLWLAYSGGKFGYSVQAKVFSSKKIGGNFDRFFERIGWKNKEGSLLRWLPDKGNEFIYELDAAPEGHLPLTSALRGTQLLQGLLEHKTWEREEFSD